MLNASSLNAVNSSRFSQHFAQPLYPSYCFANLPVTIQYLLTGRGKRTLPADVLGPLPTSYDKVVLFFVDAFGWRFFEKYGDRYPLLKAFLKEGVVSKITSQFPSTTPAHVTCINTGLNVAQSGIYEWNYYEPLVDALITPLRFSYAGDSRSDTLYDSGMPSEAFYPKHTFHQTLRGLGVQSHIFQPGSLAYSTYSNSIFRGATSLYAYRNLEEGLAQLTSRVLVKEESPAYYLFYYNDIDAACHLAGPDSEHLARAIETFFLALEQFFLQKLRYLTGDTLLILTADHGQTEVSSATTVYLNREIPEIERYFKKSKAGKTLVPAGSARDMFLHVQEECLDETIELLQRYLHGRAEIYRTQDLIQQNLFGSTKPSNAFLTRVGNVVILPYARETVWWFEAGRFDMHFQGHHGGLTPEEIELPLLLLPL